MCECEQDNHVLRRITAFCQLLVLVQLLCVSTPVSFGLHCLLVAIVVFSTGLTEAA